MKTGPTVGLKDSTPVELEHHGCRCDSHDSQWVPSTQLYRAAVVQTKNYGKSENNVILEVTPLPTTMPHHGQIYDWLATDYNHLHASFVVVNINSCP
ncbi:hypothetical protein NQZ68_002437 [Dissostichus eleginoides]|nr:hypothetical protein NQZ68_002437 [Dissostichus eleginoides]